MSKSKTKQKKSSAGKNIAIFFIVFVILEGLIIFGLSRLFKTEDSVVKVGGYSFFLMDSSNMGADAPENALVIASNGTPAKDKIGLAVLCKNVEGEGTTVAWLYDIGSKGDTVDGVVYTVYQEKNRDKMFDLNSDDIVGVATSYYQTAGNIIAFVTTPFGMAICIVAPLFLLVLIELIIAIAHRSNDDEDDDEYDDEYEEDEAGDNVTLDDFLYGGENDNVYTTTKPKDTYEEEFEDKYAAMMNRAKTTPAPELKFDNTAAEVKNEAVPEEPAVQEPIYSEPAEEVKPQVAPEYYEKASKMIDDAVASHSEEVAEAEKEPEQKPQTVEAPAAPVNNVNNKKTAHKRPANQQHRRQNRSSVQHQDANAALAELMKMMEEEQKKIRNNDDKK
jgi:hypothetical protein